MTSADATGFHILAAKEADGYAFKTVATLSELGFDTDAWIGNACVTASGTRAAVAYAPRTFTNKPELMTRGAFTAIVDLTSGKVTKLPHTATLGYFSPACGTGEEVVFSQFTDDDSKENATRLVRVDAGTGKAVKPLKLAGQLTSAVPTPQGNYLAAAGVNIVHVSQDGQVRTVAQTNAIPFQLTADATGGLTFIDRASAGQAQAEHLSAGQLDSKRTKTKPQALAAGKLTGFDLARSADGQVVITGDAQTKGRSLPGTVKNPGGIAKGATISTTGEAAVSTGGVSAKQQRKDLEAGPETALPVHPRLTDLGTGNTAKMTAHPTPEIGQAYPSPALGVPAGNSTLAAGDPNNPVEAERYCSVARNHTKKQAFQPTPRQVEWAVNQAISGHLNDWISRPSDWKGTGMGAYSPQSLFPLKPLSGGGQIPAQIMLGITAQESNMWQATRFAVPGVIANSLIGNYYGIEYNPDGGQVDPWAIKWEEADCGYGITQVTDGMRMHGKEKEGEKPLTTAQQEAVALDYTANIAAGVNILVEKWNQTRDAGMTVNGGNPKYIENWFFALWAYNSGFYPESSADDHYGHWGVGFTNNPANPLWKANRTPFLEGPDGKDDYSHAAHPQDWPYPEKVAGWAARPLSAQFAPGDMQIGYRPAWWNSDFVRTQAKPPMGLFCDSSNHCDPSRIGENDSNDQGKGACLLDDPRMVDHLHCWWNTKVSWKDCGAAASCGNAIHRFNHTDYPEQRTRTPTRRAAMRGCRPEPTSWTTCPAAPDQQDLRDVHAARSLRQDRSSSPSRTGTTPTPARSTHIRSEPATATTSTSPTPATNRPDSPHPATATACTPPAPGHSTRTCLGGPRYTCTCPTTEPTPARPAGISLRHAESWPPKPETADGRARWAAVRGQPLCSGLCRIRGNWCRPGRVVDVMTATTQAEPPPRYPYCGRGADPGGGDPVGCRGRRVRAPHAR